MIPSAASFTVPHQRGALVTADAHMLTVVHSTLVTADAHMLTVVHSSHFSYVLCGFGQILMVCTCW